MPTLNTTLITAIHKTLRVKDNGADKRRGEGLPYSSIGLLLETCHNLDGVLEWDRMDRFVAESVGAFARYAKGLGGGLGKRERGGEGGMGWLVGREGLRVGRGMGGLEAGLKAICGWMSDSDFGGQG